MALFLLLFLPALYLNASIHDLFHEQPDRQPVLAPLLTLPARAFFSTAYQSEQIPFKTFLQSRLTPPTVSPERQGDLHRQLNQLINKNNKNTYFDETENRSKSLILYLSVISGEYRIVLPRIDVELLSIAPQIVELILDHELLLILSTLSLEKILTLLYHYPASSTAAAGGSGGGDGDDGDNNENFRRYSQSPTFLFFFYPLKQRAVFRLTPMEILKTRLQHKLWLLTDIRRKLKFAVDDNLKKIYRDRIMIIQADYDDLKSELQKRLESYNSDTETGLFSSYEELHELLIYYFAHLPDGLSIFPDQLAGGLQDMAQKALGQQQDHPPPSPEDRLSQKPDEQSEHQPGGEGDHGDDKNDPPEKDSVPAAHIIEMSYSQKVEAFLAIPEEDFLRLDNQLKVELLQKLLEQSRQSSNAKTLMAKAIFTWQKSHNKEEARKLFMQAYELSQKETANDFDPDDQILAWLMIHKYKKLLDGTSEDADADALELHSYFHRPAKQANSEILPLLIMYYSGALPGIRSTTDIEMYLQLLDKFENCIAQYQLHYFFPVSFTALDRIRWVPMADTVYESLDLSSMSTLQSCLHYILLRYMTEWNGHKVNENSYLSAVPEKQFNDDIFVFINKLRTGNMKNLNHGEVGYNETINHFKSIAEGLTNERPFGDDNWILTSILYQYCAVMERKKNKLFHKQKIFHKKKVLNWYKLAAGHSPELWHRIFQDALNIGMTDLAIEAGQQLHTFWESRSPLIADYWQERLESLSSQYRKTTDTLPGPTQEAESPIPDWVLAETPASGKSEPRPGSKKTRKGKKKRSYKAAKTSPIALVHEQTAKHDPDVDALAEGLSPMDIAALPGAAIKVGKKQSNIADSSRSDDQWRVRASKRTIRPFERIYQKNWNEQVHSIIKQAHASRKTNNPKEEYDLYLKLLKGTSNSMVGIERIWEEMGWLLLHQYDGFYATQTIPEDLRKTVLDTAFKAKDQYFLPAIASHLGMDEMNHMLSPEKFFQLVHSILTDEHFDTIAGQIEFARRLRCLASSVAHSFSLAAMASPRNQKLRELARNWYKAKNDLITQERTLKISQENQLRK